MTSAWDASSRGAKLKLHWRQPRVAWMYRGYGHTTISEANRSSITKASIGMSLVLALPRKPQSKSCYQCGLSFLCSHYWPQLGCSDGTNTRSGQPALNRKWWGRWRIYQPTALSHSCAMTKCPAGYGCTGSGQSFSAGMYFRAFTNASWVRTWSVLCFAASLSTVLM